MHRLRKKNVNVLITSAGREVALVKAFLRAVGGAGSVVVVDVNPLSAAFCYATHAYVVPRCSDPSFLPVLLRLCRKHAICLLIPMHDGELPFFAREKKQFERVGVTVMISSPEAVEICNDKLRFVQFCTAHGFRVPRTYGSRQALGRGVPYPLFVNDRHGRGSRSAFRVRTRQDLLLALKVVENPIIQEFVDEKEYTIDAYADFDGRVISVVPRERIFVFGGESYVGKTVKNADLIQESIRLMKALNLVGHVTIQAFCTGEKVTFIEVNPRFGGGANLGFAAGADTPRSLVKAVAGQRLRPRIGRFVDGLIMLRHGEDVFLRPRDLVWKRAG